ncbi:magnesium transporter, partial [candidate division KSB1 bacterium]|nr:magnesium transporter [candidate division KSB1 bacterium]
DDTIDVLRDEATEDFLKMAGTGTEEIIEQSVFSSLKVRSPWLLASLAGGLIAANVIHSFESLLEQIILLSAFLPVIIGMGGNVGIQSTTLMVRGLATGRIDIKHIGKVLVKEIKVGFALGLCYGILLSVLALILANVGLLTSDSNIGIPLIGLIVGLGIFSSMFIATTVGTFIPLFFAKLKIDPALASGPFVTTAIDILGVGSYLIIASSFIN